MEPEVEATPPYFRSGSRPDVFGFGISKIHCQQRLEIGGSSFTALLELPPPQAVELLVNEDSPAPFFPSNVALIDRASRFSVFASATNLPESNLTLTGSSSLKLDVVKREPLDSVSRPNSSSSAVSNQSPKCLKRKETEKKVGEPNKKSKQVVANETTEDTSEKLPYFHVRTRPGQATDSHSLVERARREKINARMKLLQELVPGCNKISGTAMVLDEIINHVQALQRQVEFLSMRLAVVNPRSEFNFDALLAKESEPAVERGHSSMFTPEGQVCRGRQQPYRRQTWHFNELPQPAWGREDHLSNFITPDNYLLSFDSSPSSASLHSSQLNMEL